MSELRDRFPTGPEHGRALLLPGRAFGPSKPLLGAVEDVLLARGWAVRQVRWEVPDGLDGLRATAWVTEQTRMAATGWSDRPLLVGKSLGTRAASFARKERLDAIWLTPLLRDRRVVRAIRRSRARQLLVGGTADGLAWDGAVARSLGAEVLELPDADHGLAVRGDRQRTSAYRDRLREAVDAWLV
ncbi:hypothetical protein [Nocardioides terrae]|uniref:hypothetical protein n=1 Tax=Nocardioides terrae TaxID=574651 RepID=UPI000B828B18|nr:hypothetical protein [Nocardioides terrae]